jgi:hypothetical protein
MSCQLVDAEYAPDSVRALDPSAPWFLTWEPGRVAIGTKMWTAYRVWSNRLTEA